MSSGQKSSWYLRLGWTLCCIVLILPLLSWAQSSKKSSSTTPAPAQHSTSQPARQSTVQQHQQKSNSGVNRGSSGGATVVHGGPGGGFGHPSSTTNRNGGPTISVTRTLVAPGHYQPSNRDQTKTLAGGYKEYSQSGRTVRTDATGQVRHVEVQGIAGKTVINRVPGGGREVITGRPGARTVSWGPNRGYVERPLRPGYISRTYVYGGRSYAYAYREYHYGTFAYYRYVPAYYYGPRFYGWVATPWVAPVAYPWPVVAYPWFGFYAGYYTPYGFYGSPDLWLTDYLMSENLRMGYDNQHSDESGTQANQQVSNAQPTVTPEMKAMIADEVRQQLAAEQAAAAQPPSAAGAAGSQAPPALSQKFFVVASNLEVTANGQPCTLTPGDIIERRGKDAGPDGNVAVEVVSSKKGDCLADSSTPAQVQLTDLQEMHNQFMQNLDSGLKVLADGQTKGLPAAPAANAQPVPDGTVTPSSDAGAILLAQDRESTKLESQMSQGNGN